MSSADTQTSVDQLRTLLEQLPDPEIPVLTLGDLGIVRGLEHGDHGRLVVRLTPTYCGCPAIDAIRVEVERLVRDAGYDDVEVRLQLAPAWSTDEISEAGRRKLERYGIAPPQPGSHPGCPVLAQTPRCPLCGSEDVREQSRFGPTPCLSQYACQSCLEPFTLFKTLR